MMSARQSIQKPIRSRVVASSRLFDWPLTVVGLYIFTLAVVTFRFPVAEVGIAIAVIGLFLQASAIRTPLFVWIYAGFVLWAFVSSFASQFPELASKEVIERIKQAVIMLVVVNALRTERQIRFYLLFFVSCFVLFPIRGAIVNYAVGQNVMGRMVWNYIYDNPNDLAALCALAFGVALSLALSRGTQKIVRIGCGAAATIIFVVIMMTQSRGTFIGLLFCMAPVLLLRMAKRGRIVLYVLIAAAGLFLILPAGVWERFGGIRQLTSTATIAMADREGSAEERWKIQKVAWRIFADHPIAGVGLGAYRNANNMYAPELGRRDTHNTYLNLAAELGLPGLLLWLTYFLSVLVYASRVRRSQGSGTLSFQQVWIERALLCLLVAAAFGTYSALTMPGLMLSVLWCCAKLVEESVGTEAYKTTLRGN